ncbi:MAG: glycosyltransferase family 4 protein [Ruminococcaceae bacterium]|nr:glycosyltransferase family 4 protein [Oscillospiraceae bacterium]
MKVVEAISDTNIGGAGILLWTRLKHSDRKNIESTVLLPKGSALCHRFASIGIHTVEIDGCRDRSMDIHAIGGYRRVLKQLSPDLVNCHGCMSCRIAARLSSIPISIYTRHCAYPPRYWQTTAIGKALICQGQQRLSHHIIAVAEAAKQNLIQMGTDPHQISVVINGVEGLRRLPLENRAQIRRQLNISPSAILIGMFGRLEPCKGHTILLQAAKELVEMSDHYHFLIVGSGSLEKALKHECATSGISSHFHFTGFAEDVSPYMNITDIVVNCSTGTETSSLALSEGMSLGLPCVVSDYGGNPYMVHHGINGLVYPTGNAHRLAEQLRELSTDPELYRKLSAEAYRRFCTELNAEHMTKETEALYWKLYRTYQGRLKRRE